MMCRVIVIMMMVLMMIMISHNHFFGVPFSTSSASKSQKIEKRFLNSRIRFKRRKKQIN
jgi:hypothetical protein